MLAKHRSGILGASLALPRRFLGASSALPRRFLGHPRCFLGDSSGPPKSRNPPPGRQNHEKSTFRPPGCPSNFSLVAFAPRAGSGSGPEIVLLFISLFHFMYSFHFHSIDVNYVFHILFLFSCGGVGFVQNLFFGLYLS